MLRPSDRANRAAEAPAKLFFTTTGVRARKRVEVHWFGSDGGGFNTQQVLRISHNRQIGVKLAGLSG